MTQRYFSLLMLFILALAIAGDHATADPEKFTIEQVMSAPFPSGLTAAPKGGRLAWVMNDQGRRNLWVADPPEYRGMAVTEYAKDDGQDITELEWAPDGAALAFVRGGAANGQGEIPNPVSDPAGVKQEVWLLDLKDRNVRRIGEGNGPAISPKGDRIAFIQKGQIWSAPLAESSEAKQLVRARGQCGLIRWSPDGSKLAFVSGRGDHSFVGVYDVAGESVRYLDASVDRDNFPVWSQDGKSIAFMRFPANKARAVFAPRREGEPWSIRIADLATGQGREVWRAKAGRGSVFREVVAENMLFWCAGDRLIFPWEGDGWTHLYSVSTKGSEAALLTPGAFEVEDVSQSSDGAEIVYSSNQGDIDRRHIWRVSAAGGPPKAVTTGETIEWSPVMTSDGRAVAFLSSSSRLPAHPEILEGTSKTPRDLAPDSLPKDFPKDKLVDPAQVVFAGADGMQIHGQLFLPRGVSDRNRAPAMIFFHGGSRRQMLLGWHYGSYYHNCYAMNQYLASRGYVVLSVNYRSGTGYGLEFREAENYGATGASEFNDVLGAGLYLRGRSEVDPNRIGLWGGSYGGYLTALGLSRAPELFATGVDIHGVHDWNIVTKNFLPSYDPQKDTERAKLAFDSSPMASIKGWKSPVLLIHGDDDRNVPFSESVDLAEALRKQGVEFEQLIFPDEVHGFLTHSHWVAAFKASADFLERRLAGKK